MNDFRFAIRQLAKSPGFTFIALLTLALGIGLNTSMFSLMNLLILKPLPYPASEQLARVNRTTPQTQVASHSASDYLDLMRETATFADIGAFCQWGYTLTMEGRPSVNLNALRVSSRFLPALGLKPAAGRWFTAEEDDPGNHVVILSYETWQAHFGGNPGVVGQTIRIDGEPTTVVGVMPASFSSVFLWGPADALRPLGLTAAEKQRQDEVNISLISRHAGLTLEQFNTRLATVATQLAELRPKDRSRDGLHAVSLASTVRTPQTIALSWMVVGIAGIVLLIACANLANLQIARAIARSHEFAIRTALGASRSNLLRPLLVESLLLAVAGGGVGLLVAVWTNDWVSSRLSSSGLFKISLELDWRVIGFASAVSVFTGVLFGLAPAWLLSRIRANESLKSGARGNTGDRVQNRLQHALIITQFSNALIVLVGAAGFIRAADRIVTINPGWDQTAIVQSVLNLPPARYATPAQTYRFYTQLEQRLAALPGAESATIAWTLPIFQFLTSRSMIVEGKAPPEPGREPVAYVNAVMPSFLSTLGVKLSSGRNFNDADTLASSPVVIINASMARTLFPGEDPIGHRIGTTDAKNPAWAEIVGVIPDLGFAVGAVPQRTPFQVLRPLAQETWNYVTVAVRSRNPAALAEPMRQAIASLDSNLAIQQSGTIREVTRLVTSSAEMLSTVLLSFALLGLFLAAIGLYGVLARIVVQRTPEIGVRVALGAQAGDIVRLILSSGLKLTFIGTAIGLAGAIALGFVISRLVPGASAGEPLVFVVVTVVLISVGFVACWLPARRAARVDPLIALRSE
ncbi:MAG: ABC transporter permease [Opitutus sp.]